MNVTLSLEEKETNRLKALWGYGIDFHRHELFFDEIAQLALGIGRIASVFILFFDYNQLRVKGSAGSDYRLQLKKCIVHEAIIQQGRYLEIEDILKHPVYCKDPAMLEDPLTRFQAGMPIVNSDGYVLGAICLMDQKARKFTGDQIHSIGILSRILMRFLDLKRNW